MEDSPSSPSPSNSSSSTPPSSSSPPPDSSPPPSPPESSPPPPKSDSSSPPPPKSDSSSPSPPPSKFDSPSPPPPESSPPPKSDSSPPPPSPNQSPPPKSESSPPPASPPPTESSPSPPSSTIFSPPSPKSSDSFPSDDNDNPNTQSPPPSSNSSSSSPPPTTNTKPSPSKNTSFNEPNSPPSSTFSPPTPISPESSLFPSEKALPTSPPSRDASSNKSPSSLGSNNSPPHEQSSSSTVAIVAAVSVTGLLILAVVIVCLLCNRKKKKQPYYVDPAHPPKGGDPYYNTGNYSSPHTDHIVTLAPPPGVMGTPQEAGLGWTPPPPPPAANTSSEFSSGYSSHVPGGGPATIPSPNYGGLSKIQFTYADLATATGGFSEANVLGQGGFGFVHKGVLTDGSVVAVKSLKSGSGQGEREFQAEVEIISRVHHRHLVSLVGYCITDGQRMLVYEFVSNGTLEYHLHGKGRPVMDWGLRLKIALGSAKGLAYLHEDCHPRIIHRDIKGANILLDNNYEAMVADFGLAKLTEDNNTHVSTRVMGTFGYLAPEYASSGKLSEKSDVFSFGVMLLELITGRRPLDTTNKLMDDSLVDWARPFLTKALEENNYDELVDPRLEGNYDPDELQRMVACAAASVRHSARRRPKMSQILRALDGDSSLEDLNEKAGKNNTANFGGASGPTSDLYDTCAYNADMVKFRQMVMTSQDMNSSEYGNTSDYGLHPSDTSSEFSSDYNHSGAHKQAK
ncbi:proline-rich receptor-like protein kinase PERK1 [Solanum stenotomum]|uniref:proline-rich receptor-like protein kinase PERK1 n=1 Tax=Solanum stenotomum TaxID=172797 RepID=UPI0020D13387|nr:proline-rich receptor-like protein kinase PERK1 [Solanum stenotomum]